MRNLLIRLEAGFRNRWFYCKGYLLKFYLFLHGCKVGKRLKCKQWPIFRVIPNRNISIGDHVTLGYGITLEPIPGGRIILCDYVHLTQNVLISAREEVNLGKYVSIAENVSIRDSDHGIAKGIIPHFQKSISQPIVLKDGSGVGRGSAIFRGFVLEEGAIIGAHCILMRNTKTIPNGIYFGSPPRLIAKRK